MYMSGRRCSTEYHIADSKKLHESKNVESCHKKSQLGGGGGGSQINMTRMMVEYVENAPLKVTT